MYAENCLEQLDYPSNDKSYFVDYSPIIDRKSTIIGEFIVQSNKDEEEFDTKKLQEIKVLAESIVGLYRQAFLVYEPIVDNICSGRKVESKELENILDGLVSMCASDEMLGLFKRVCRKFYNQYPDIITDYVLFYKEMYEEEEDDL